MRVIGNKNFYAPIKRDYTRLVISFNPIEVNDRDYTWNELVYHWTQELPSFEQLKSDMLQEISDEVKNNIVSGYTWLHLPVWLSIENQANYKNALDVAVQTDGGNLPVTFKFGTDESPVYYEFKTIDELRDFWIDYTGYIARCQSDGWKVRESINWDDYRLDGIEV